MARTKAVLGAGARLSDYLSASLLAQAFPSELVAACLDRHGRNSQRFRDFHATAGVYYCMALSLYPEASYESVFSVVSSGLAWSAGQPMTQSIAKSSKGARVKSCIHTFLISSKGFVLQKKELLAHVVPRLAAFFVQDFDLSSPCGAFKAVQTRSAGK